MSELVLEVAQLRASYGKVQALHDIDLRLERGSIATVIGPNGAGKSTCSTPSWGCCRRRNGALSRSGGGALDAGAACHGRYRPGAGRRELFSSMSVEDNLLLGCFRRLRCGRPGRWTSWPRSSHCFHA
jgi:branched-chain amino acid transport system ATP-binding protein